MNMNITYMEQYMEVPEPICQYDKPWSCFREFTCIIWTINMYSNTTCKTYKSYKGVNKY